MKFRPRLTKNTLIFGGVAVWGLVLISCVAVNRTVLAPPSVPGASFAGNKACTECHENTVGHFGSSSHSRLALADPKLGDTGCEACHGPGSIHVKSGGLKGTIVNPRKSPEACFQCHLDKRGEFSLSNSHAVLNGRMSCGDCHDPHEGNAIKGKGASLEAENVITPVPLTGANSSSIDEKVWTPEVDVRYTGIKSMALYAAWDYRTSPGDERLSYVGITTSTAGPVVLSPAVIVNDKVKEKHANFKIGANWTVSPMLTLRAEFFSRDHENNFNGYGTSLGSYYVLDYDIYGARVTAIAKLSPTLSFTTRYVQQRGKAEVAEDGYITGDSNDSKRYHIGETINWNPTKLFYMQANVNVVFDKTSTAYPRAGGTANDVLHNADNNYWNGNVVAGFVVDKQTDATVQATYYRANNYNPALAVATDPYGAGAREYGIFAGVKHKFNDKLLGNAKVGYLDRRNDTAGGNSDFHGPLAYVSLEHAF